MLHLILNKISNDIFSTTNSIIVHKNNNMTSKNRMGENKE